MNNRKGSDSIDDSTSRKDTPTPSSWVSQPPPLFPNQLMGKKAQSHVDKIRETFSQVKMNIRLLDVIQQMPPIRVFSKNCLPLRETQMSPKGHS